MFNQESLMISHLNDWMAVAAFLERVSSPYCLTALAREAPRTMTDLRYELDKHIRVGELLGGRNLSTLSRPIPSWKDEKDEASPSNREEKKKNKEDRNNPELK